MVGLKILVVGGDDEGYHDFTVIGKVFCSCFHPENLKEYDVVVCYMSRKEVPEHLEKGLLGSIIGSPWGATGKPKGFIGIHTGGYSFPESAAYHNMVGARFLTHPEMGEDLLIKVTDPDHPVMKGITSFTIVDELYLMEMYPPFHVLLSCHYRGFERPIAWVKPYGLGRVFYTSLGHGQEQVRNESFVKMIVNAVKWSVETE
jgi:type 1 glutamine amidotransferase